MSREGVSESGGQAMDDRRTVPGPDTAARPDGGQAAGRARWPVWAPYAALMWSVLYGALGLWWVLGGAGFPFSPAVDPAAAATLLGGPLAAAARPVVIALGLPAGLLAAGMIRSASRGRATSRWAALGTSGVVVAVLFFVVPDYRPLVAVAYAPIALIGAPFGLLGDASYTDALPWPVLHQLLCLGGGYLWLLASLAYARRTRDACGSCGRTDAAQTWSAPEAAARWGAVATWVAVVIPLLYAATRWAWALGVPLGISAEFLTEMRDSGILGAAAGLASFGIIGAILTLGLIQRWGEVFPRWMVGLAGRRVPIGLAVVPASAVAVLVTTAGLMYVRFAVTGRIPLGTEWAALAPELVWPLWGAALAAAALAYYLRRRGGCVACHRA